MKQYNTFKDWEKKSGFVRDGTIFKSCDICDEMFSDLETVLEIEENNLIHIGCLNARTSNDTSE